MSSRDTCRRPHTADLPAARAHEPRVAQRSVQTSGLALVTLCDMLRFMKRTTIMLPDETEARLRLEARRRGVPIAQVVREAVERHLPAPEPGRRLSFFGVGEGGPADASERVDEYAQRAVRRRRRH